jgi:hypothetical protein
MPSPYGHLSSSKPQKSNENTGAVQMPRFVHSPFAPLPDTTSLNEGVLAHLESDPPNTFTLTLTLKISGTSSNFQFRSFFSHRVIQLPPGNSQIQVILTLVNLSDVNGSFAFVETGNGGFSCTGFSRPLGAENSQSPITYFHCPTPNTCTFNIVILPNQTIDFGLFGTFTPTGEKPIGLYFDPQATNDPL